MQDALDQNQQLTESINALQEDMQTLQLQMDAARSDKTAAEVELAQQRLLCSQASEDKSNLELTMQQFHKAYDELEATKAALLADKTRVEQQLGGALKAANTALASAQDETSKGQQALMAQHVAERDKATQQSVQSVSAKDLELQQLQRRCAGSGQALMILSIGEQGLIDCVVNCVPPPLFHLLWSLHRSDLMLS